MPRVRVSGSKTRKKFSQDRSKIEEARKNNIDRLNCIEKELFELNEDGCLLETAKDVIESIKQADKQLKANEDKYSEGGSDSEP